VPVQDANRFRSANRATSPTSAQGPGGNDRSDAGDVHQVRPTRLDHRLQLSGQRFHLLLDRNQLVELLGRESTSGLACKVAGTNAGQDRLRLQGGDVLLPPPWGQLREQALKAVDGLHPLSGKFLASVSEHAQGLELSVMGKDAKTLSPDRDHGDRVRVMGVGLAVVAGVEQPCSGRELGRHVHDVLARLQKALRQWATCTVASLDRPRPFRPGSDVPAHRGEARLVGGESA
jgi:hypothetical protein